MESGRCDHGVERIGSYACPVGPALVGHVSIDELDAAGADRSADGQEHGIVVNGCDGTMRQRCHEQSGRGTLSASDLEDSTGARWTQQLRDEVDGRAPVLVQAGAVPALLRVEPACPLPGERSIEHVVPLVTQTFRSFGCRLPGPATAGHVLVGESLNSSAKPRIGPAGTQPAQFHVWVRSPQFINGEAISVPRTATRLAKL